MPILRTDDPAKDYLLYDAEREERLARMPVCSDCGEHVQGDQFYVFTFRVKDSIVPTFRVVCEECLNDHKVDADEYLERRGLA